jgi:glycosyltransferase involved in cell wall biosynthesis
MLMCRRLSRAGQPDGAVYGLRVVHVGLNLIYLVPGETGGMEVVARELIPELVRAAPDTRFTAFVNPHAAGEAGAPWNALARPVVVPVDARNRVQWVRGEQQLLPRLGARHGVDLMHSLASTAPAWGRFRRVVTIHDLIYRFYPEAHSGVRSFGMRGLVRLAAARSHRLIADSASTRDDLVRHLRADPSRVDVVPLGVGSTRSADATSEAELRARHGLGSRRVVLSVSAKRPHKNLRALLDALAGLPAHTRPALVLPGYATWHEAELREHAERLGVTDDVRFLGWISAMELEGLYGLADCFVFPSLYEGFGLPVLEAMRRGVPVACSNASSLPEVAGDAALLFDPKDTEAIRRAMERLLVDRQLANELAERGLKRADAFSWERSARETLASYERALAA